MKSTSASRNFANKFSGAKYSVIGFAKANQLKIFILGAIILLALITGVFSAVKYIQGAAEIIFSDFGLKAIIKGSSGTATMFWSRLWSILAVMLLLMVFSLHGSIFWLGGIVLIYRSFLLGLNVTFIILLQGLSGIIIGILIVFPFQLLMILLMAIFFIIARDRCITKSKYGTKNGVNLFLLFLIFLIILTVINLAETMLLVLTSAKVILII